MRTVELTHWDSMIPLVFLTRAGSRQRLRRWNRAGKMRQMRRKMDRNRMALMLDAATKRFLLGISTFDSKTVQWKVYEQSELKGENLLFKAGHLLKENG